MKSYFLLPHGYYKIKQSFMGKKTKYYNMQFNFL
jgi:hypothetical protein